MAEISAVCRYMLVESLIQVRSTMKADMRDSLDNVIQEYKNVLSVIKDGSAREIAQLGKKRLKKYKTIRRWYHERITKVCDWVHLMLTSVHDINEVAFVLYFIQDRLVLLMKQEVPLLHPCLPLMLQPCLDYGTFIYNLSVQAVRQDLNAATSGGYSIASINNHVCRAYDVLVKELAEDPAIPAMKELIKTFA